MLAEQTLFATVLSVKVPVQLVESKTRVIEWVVLHW
jgi:hypothetical protein